MTFYFDVFVRSKSSQTRLKREQIRKEKSPRRQNNMTHSKAMSVEMKFMSVMDT